MGELVGGITDAIGLTDHAGEKKAAAAAASNAAAANAMSAEQIQLAKDQLDFTKTQYNDWKAIYGDVQDNLGTYYKDLTPDKITALGLENQQKEFQQVDTALERDYAQRGISNSGQEVLVESNNAVNNATARAAIRTNAYQAVVDEKLKSLGVGLNQGTQLLATVGNSASNVTNAFSNGVNSRTNITNSYLGQATQFGVSNMNAMSDLVSSGAYLAKTK